MAQQPSQSVSVQVIRVVKAGQEKAFEESLKAFFEESKVIPGQLGLHVVRPPEGSGSREWGILRTFESAKHRDDFYESDLFLNYHALAAQFTEGEKERKHLCGLETWFTTPGSQAMIPPPRWKMALVTWLGVYITTQVIGLFLGRYLQKLPGWLSPMVGVALTVIALTWIVMPNLVRLMQPWLKPKPS